MTAREQQNIDNINQAIKELREENKVFKEATLILVNSLKEKVENKHVPLSLEQSIIQASQGAIQKAINDTLGGYNSPLQKYITVSIEKYDKKIIQLLEESFAEEIGKDEFKRLAKEELLHKVVKSIISGIDGSVDKVVNQLKQDSVFRSKLVLFTNNLIEEFIKK